MFRNRISEPANDTAFGRSNFSGTDYIVINATTPEDDGKYEEGMSKKKNTAQKKFEYAIQNGHTVLFEEVGE